MSHNAEPLMNAVNTAEQRGPGKGRKIVVVLLCFLLVVALLLYITAYFLLNSERIRSELEGRLTAMVGLPASIDALGLRLLPNPGVALHGVRIGPDDAHLDADVCEALLDLRSLTRGELRVTHAYVRAATLALPEAPLLAADRLDMLVDAMREHQAQRRDMPPSWIQIEIDAVTVRHMRIMLGDVVLAAGDARLDNATSPQVDAVITAALLPLGDGSHLTVSARFTRRKGAPLGVSGDAALTFRKAFALNRAALLPEIVVEGRASFTGDSMDDIALTLAGSAAFFSNASPVQGAFTANAWWQRDAFIVNDLRWQSPGFILHADATIPVREAEPAMHIHNATLGMPLMQTVVDLLVPPSLRLVAKSDAAVVVTDLLAGLSLEPLPRLASGEIMIAGVSVINAAGQPLLDDVRVAAEVEEGRLRLRQLTGGGWTAEGWIAPDTTAHSIAFEIRAAGSVDKARLALLAPAQARKMDEIGAALEFTEVTGAYNLKQKRFAVSNCAGTLSHGRMVYRHTETAPPFFLDDVNVLFRYEDAVVHLDELRFGNTALRGKAHVAASQPPRVELTGTIHLSDVPLAMLPPGLSLSNMEGRLDATVLSVVVPHDAPPQTSLSGALQDAGMVIEAAAFHDRLSGVS
ncbi:MAG TPA: hypothetical protein ENN29_04765, partial [Candidatus Hydrogenedentes bacterium]|nr:hypothetical protein [Candidatus Hydrogenedentota bacterium]